MSSRVFTAEDIISTDATLGCVLENLESWRVDRSSRLATYGKSPLQLNSNSRLGTLRTNEEVRAYTRWVSDAFKHSAYIANNPSAFLPMLTTPVDSFAIKHAGIESLWSTQNLDIKVKRSAVERVLAGIATADNTANEHGWSRGIAYKFVDHRLSDSFISDSREPLLVRAIWSAKRQMLMQASIRSVDVRSLMTEHLFLLTSEANDTEGISLQAAAGVMQVVQAMSSQKIDTEAVRRNRSSVLALQATAQRTEEAQMRLLKSQNFSKYWDDMKTKQRAKVVSPEVTAVDWATIPIAESGTETSRTWGIEVETVRYQDTSRPRGWSDVHDGSLPDSDDDSGGCDCGCNVCDSGEHCDYSSNECYGGSSESSDNESRELVSPVLNHFNSAGLQQICTDLGDDEDSTAPGIHVHVGANNVTTADVARLLYAYGVVAPLIKPLYHRDVYGYCTEMDSSNVQWWLGAVKTHLREHGSIPNPRDICQEQPASRYQDVNLHSLAKHGTIEFRSMGPFYNYEHLVRWAWFCREMVNVSTLGLDQSLWTACKTLEDVIVLLRKYGTELPLTETANTNKIALVLADTEE